MAKMRAFSILILSITVLIEIYAVHLDDYGYHMYQHCYQEGGACNLKNITCDENYVIDVAWSLVGFSEYWKPDTTRTNCSITNETCYKQIVEPAENCTGLRECWIETCSNSTHQVIDCTDLDATNYMLINYTCVPDTTSPATRPSSTTRTSTPHPNPSSTESTTPYTGLNTTIGSTTSHTQPSSSTKSTSSFPSTSSSTESTNPSTVSSPSTAQAPDDSGDKTRALIIGLTTVSVILLIVCIILIVLLVAKRSTRVAPEPVNEATEARRESAVLRKASATFVNAKKNMSYLASPTATSNLPSLGDVAPQELPDFGAEDLDMDVQSDEEGESHA